jgi:hypothetical protein
LIFWLLLVAYVTCVCIFLWRQMAKLRAPTASMSMTPESTKPLRKPKINWRFILSGGTPAAPKADGPV